MVGVLPASFRLWMGARTNVPPRIEAWVPQNYWINRNLRWLRVIARLKPGVSFEQAQAEMDAIASRLHSEYQEYANTGIRFHVVPLHGDLVREVRPTMLALLGAVGFVLLIACANVANLLLSRATQREKEIAIRAALGATRARIVRQILTENILLALVGGAGGLLLAQWGVDLLLFLKPANLPRLEDIGMDGTVLAFALGASLLTGVFFGMLPALQVSHPNLNEALKEGGRTDESGSRSRLCGLLVVFEVALSLVLLIGAGLMIRTFFHLLRVDAGFRSNQVLTAKVPVSRQKFSSPASRWNFYRQLKEGVDALPGVRSSSAISLLPLGGGFFTSPYAYDPATEETWGRLSADYLSVVPDYFQTLGTRILVGRDFSELDSESERLLVIVDETLARQAWPDQNPVGKLLKIDLSAGAGQGDPQWAEVIGVVQHTRRYQLHRDGRPQVYLPFWSRPAFTMSLVVRSTTDPSALVPAVRSEVRSLGSGRPVHTIRTMDEYVYDAMADSRFALVLMGIFSSIALVLSVVGIYGVISYSVSQRTHEIGIRMALGAQPRDIFKLVVGQGMVLTLIGVGVGLAASFALTRFLESLLFGVSATDPATFAGVALLACYLPARRATKVDPLVALRYE